MNISLRNLFQAKTIKEDKENKVDLFRLDFSSSVDFERDEQKVSPLVTSFDFMPLKIITTRLTATHIFYDENDTFNLFDPTLNDLNVTTRVGLSQQSLGFMGMSSRSNANASLERDEFDMRESGGEESGGGGGGGKAFDLQFSHTYGLRRQQKIGPDIYKATHTIKPELSFSPSANFSVRYYCYYDIEEKNIVDQRILIGRDLHCWEANVSWVPSGYREGFYFKVNIKELPDVKVEQRRGSSRLGY